MVKNGENLVNVDCEWPLVQFSIGHMTEREVDVFDFCLWLEYDSAKNFDKSNIVWTWNKLFMTISSPLAIIIWFCSMVFENISHAKSVIQVKWGNPQTKLHSTAFFT